MSAGDPRAQEEPPRGAPWWIGLAGGGAIFVFGLAGLLHERLQTRPANMLAYVLGALVVHDALLVPAVVAFAFVLARALPGILRGGVQATLAVCGVVALLSIPVLRADGRSADNPSLLPHDYPQSLAIVLAAIVATGLLVTVLGARRRAARSDRRPRT
ncbi:MAG: hypothetical protein LC713_00500 [Actinobacteria bacterium]|nr:hypothetical protein [Actinomycetota bacterium]